MPKKLFQKGQVVEGAGHPLKLRILILANIVQKAVGRLIDANPFQIGDQAIDAGGRVRHARVQFADPRP